MILSKTYVRFLRDSFLIDSLALIGRYFQSERKSFKKFSHRFLVFTGQVSKRPPIRRFKNFYGVRIFKKNCVNCHLCSLEEFKCWKIVTKSKKKLANFEWLSVRVTLEFRKKDQSNLWRQEAGISHLVHVEMRFRTRKLLTTKFFQYINLRGPHSEVRFRIYFWQNYAEIYIDVSFRTGYFSRFIHLSDFLVQNITKNDFFLGKNQTTVLEDFS